MTHGDTLPETNSSPLKMDGWNTTFLLGWSIFRGEPLVSGRVDDHQLLSLHDGFGATKLWSCKRLWLEKLKETKDKKHVTNGNFTRLGPRNHRFFNEVITYNPYKWPKINGFSWGSGPQTNRPTWMDFFCLWDVDLDIKIQLWDTKRFRIYIYI